MSERALETDLRRGDGRGIESGPMPVTFEARKATTTKRNGKLIATGTESYRPTPHTDAFDVRYECVTDLATGKVESVTYAAVDATGGLSAKRRRRSCASG